MSSAADKKEKERKADSAIQAYASDNSAENFSSPWVTSPTVTLKKSTSVRCELIVQADDAEVRIFVSSIV